VKVLWVLVLVGTGVFAVYAWRRSRAAARAVAATVDFFAGLVTLTLGVLHTGAVIGNALRGKGVGGAATFEYNFRFYALLLVGMTLIVPGLLCVLKAWPLARGDAGAWRVPLWSCVALVAVNAPMIPVQDFAQVPGGLAGVNLIAMLLVWRGERKKIGTQMNTDKN